MGEYLSQIDSQYQVNLTLNIESIWLSISSQFDSNILQLLGILGRILVSPVTQLFRSKWLHFFQRWKPCWDSVIINYWCDPFSPAGLDGEGLLHITDGVSLSINSADGHRPEVLAHSRQLGNVRCRLGKNGRHAVIFLIIIGPTCQFSVIANSPSPRSNSR